VAVSAAPDGSKERLLVAAERLFAEYGFEAVTARQIAMEAGLRNQSAISYHFGTKDALINELISVRVTEINQRRGELLNRPGISTDIRGLIGAIAVPLAERAERDRNGGAYIRVLAHLFADRKRRDLIVEHQESAFLLRRIYGDLRTLSGIPARLFEERLRFMVGGIIFALADRERGRDARGRLPEAFPRVAFVPNLIDLSVGVLTAPVSSETADGLNATAAHSQPRR
jgi:AcrR family transcriptional regulator